jgi:hypothetical protein
MLTPLGELMARVFGTPAVGSGRNKRRPRQGRPRIVSLEVRAFMSFFNKSGARGRTSSAGADSWCKLWRPQARRSRVTTRGLWHDGTSTISNTIIAGT